MALRNKAYDLAFYAVIGTLYAFALSLSVLSATVLEVEVLNLLLLCGGFVLLFYLVFFNRYTSYVVLGILALAAIVACISLAVTKFEAGWFQQLRGFVNQIILITQKRVPNVQQYSQAFCVAFAAVFAFLTALNLRVAYNFVVLALMGVAVVCIPVYMQWGGSDTAAVLFVLCLIVLLCKSMNLQAAEEGKDGLRTNSRFALVAIPACLLLMGLSWLLPKPDQLLANLSASQRIRDAADNLIYDLGNDTVMTFSEPGQELGGPVEMNDRVIMEVVADERVFLTGSVRDTYTGSSWTISDAGKTALTTETGNFFQSSEYPDNLQDNQQYFMRYYDRDVKTIQINMMANRTKNIFTPPFRTGLEIAEQYNPSMDSQGVITLGRALDRYTNYSQEYISYNWSNAYFIAYVLQDAYVGDGISSAYLALPDGLPDRVGELAAQLTGGAASDYEKMQALSNHLSQFPYTLTPQEVPRGEDFVDHFLFEGQEGYCVYFASALAVMARTQGIPTRYVEGYVMPQEQTANRTYTVTGNYAHAWVEAYFPAFGWAPFDPTPAVYMDLASGMEPQYEEQENPIPEEEELPEEPEPEQEPEPDLPDDEILPDQDPEEPINGVGEEEPETAGALNDLPIILLTLLAIILLSFLFVRAMIHRYHTRFGKLEQMPNREATEVYFSRFLMAADVCGFPLMDNETAHAYAQRVGGQLAFGGHGTVDVGELADIFSRASYSLGEVTDRDRTTMKQAYNQLVRLLREEKRKGIKYYIDRYILMRF